MVARCVMEYSPSRSVAAILKRFMMNLNHIANNYPWLQILKHSLWDFKNIGCNCLLARIMIVSFKRVLKDYKTTILQDYKTTRLQDYKTTRLQDYKTFFLHRHDNRIQQKYNMYTLEHWNVSRTPVSTKNTTSSSWRLQPATEIPRFIEVLKRIAD